MSNIPQTRVEELQRLFYGPYEPSTLYHMGDSSRDFLVLSKEFHWKKYGQRTHPKSLKVKKVRVGTIFPLLVNIRPVLRVMKQLKNTPSVLPIPCVVRRIEECHNEQGCLIYSSPIFLRKNVEKEVEIVRAEQLDKDPPFSRCSMFSSPECLGQKIWLCPEHGYIRTSIGDLTDVNGVMPSWTVGDMTTNDFWIWLSYLWPRENVSHQHIQLRYPFKYNQFTISPHLISVFHRLVPQA